jgi:hypothetical protein
MIDRAISFETNKPAQINLSQKQMKSALSMLFDENSNAQKKIDTTNDDLDTFIESLNSFGSISGSSYDMKALDSPIHHRKSQLLNVYELIKVIVEDLSQQNNNNNNSEAKPQRSPSRYLVMPAEEDGTPMDDLPTCSSKTDLLNFGVNDFAIIDKASSEQLAHVRIEGTSQSLAEAKETKRQEIFMETEESYFILPSENESGTDSTVVCVRPPPPHPVAPALTIDTKDILSDKKPPGPPSTPKSPSRPRRRSSSGNLIITYRCKGSEKWTTAKPSHFKETKKDAFASPTKKQPNNNNKETPPLPPKKEKSPFHSPLTKLASGGNGNYTPGRMASSHKQFPSLGVNTNFDLPRRHSERPYEEEDEDPEEEMLSLNPHTSNSFYAQFSPSKREMLNKSKKASPSPSSSSYLTRYAVPVTSLRSPALRVDQSLLEEPSSSSSSDRNDVSPAMEQVNSTPSKKEKEITSTGTTASNNNTTTTTNTSTGVFSRFFDLFQS